ncbi:MAG: hypothetical protein HKO59_16340 [Phycisphaerales bacterium]|nr:hypothetical protein [Phycisphaerales bacterium]NNM27521.1 hypothetical protein [Phycisphaerales bacterium]
MSMRHRIAAGRMGPGTGLAVLSLTLLVAGCVTSARSRFERQLTATIPQSPLAPNEPPATDVASALPPLRAGVPGPRP